MSELFDSSPYTATGDIRPKSAGRKRTERNNARARRLLTDHARRVY